MLHDISSVMLNTTCCRCNYNVGTRFLAEVNNFSSVVTYRELWSGALRDAFEVKLIEFVRLNSALSHCMNILRQIYDLFRLCRGYNSASNCMLWSQVPITELLHKRQFYVDYKQKI